MTSTRPARFILLAIFLLAVALSPMFGAMAQEPTATPTPESLTLTQESGGIAIEQALVDELRIDSTTGYIIYFGDQPDLSAAEGMDWTERGEYVVQTLQENAGQSQAAVRAFLDDQGISYQSFWAENAIVVDGSNVVTLNGLMTFGEIESLGARFAVNVGDLSEVAVQTESTIEAVQANLTHVNADDVWADSIDGTGIVVANIDTGVQYTHEALVGQYRGNLGSGSFSHNYNWLDPVSSTTAPVDDQGHGTHTMGIMVGDNGSGTVTGMAPGAEWIACKACNSGGSCSDTNLLTCGQWVLAPYPSGSPASADSSKRPDVVSNSWGDCGTAYDDWYQDTVDAWVAAGIYPVFSAGNTSNCSYTAPPGCNTVGNPGRYANVTAVGSTGNHDGAYATHSNWGPSDVADTLNPGDYPYLKPQVVAPGVSIYSSYKSTENDYTYAWMTGTSMSAPHVAGLVALIWDAVPYYRGHYAATESLIEESANAIAYEASCTTLGPGNVPNCATGWGEIDALAAVQMAQANWEEVVQRCYLPWISQYWSSD